MIIDLANVGTSPRPLQAKFEPYEIDLNTDGRLADDAVFRGEMFSGDAGTHVEGMITARVETECTRCLDAVERNFEIPFRDVFVDGTRETTQRETELALGDMDESLVIGGRVDLTEVVREQILLALPEQVLCREDCRGLCAICGGNRNLIDCSCDREEIDPRWAALRNFKS